MKILGTGLLGLVGSRITALLSPQYEFENISLRTGVDITNSDQVLKSVTTSSASCVLHFAAKTDVDGCEKDKEEDKKMFTSRDDKQRREWLERKTAWAVNVIGTQNIVDACKETGKKLIYISTDFVFDGETTEDKAYTEQDDQNPINWYGQTKYEGEKVVQTLGEKGVIIRIAYPYRANFEKNDFVRALIARLLQQQPLQMITDHIMTPTYIDDIAYALDLLIKHNATGIFHIAGSQYITPYEAAMSIVRIFGLDQSLISKTTREIFFKDRAPRPFCLAVSNKKASDMGIKMKTFEEGLQEVRKQL